MFRVCTLCSSSKGNCSFITDGETNILVDCGIKVTALSKFLQANDLSLSNIDAILITHEHIDHICGLKSVTKKADIDVYAYDLVQRYINERLGIDIDYKPIDMNGFNIGKIFVKPFRISHDSIFPVGYTFTEGDKRASIATDLGFVSEEVLDNLIGSEVAIIEANHDKQMLEQGKYPMLLKRRVEGDFGHLSNDESAQLICRLCESGLKKVLLAHLSENNNLPELAYMTVCRCLEKDAKLNASTIDVEVAPSRSCSKFLEV